MGARVCFLYMFVVERLCMCLRKWLVIRGVWMGERKKDGIFLWVWKKAVTLQSGKSFTTSSL